MTIYTCQACDTPTNPDETPSPGEADEICASCFDTEGDLGQLGAWVGAGWAE